MSRESLEKTLEIRTFENKWLHQSQKIYIFYMTGNEVLQTKDPCTEVYSALISHKSKLSSTRGRTYVMITYVSKENNLGPGDKIRYILGLKGLIFIL